MANRRHKSYCLPKTENGRRVFLPRPVSKIQRQAAISHEYTHALERYQDPDAYTRKVLEDFYKGTPYREREYEKRAFDATIKAKREIGKRMRERQKIGTLMADPVLERQGALGTEGKVPPARRVGRGTKYGGGPLYGKKFMHPGARPFAIFRNTSRFIHRNMNKWMERAFNRAGFG